MAEETTSKDGAKPGKGKLLVIGLVALNLLTLGGFGAFVLLGSGASASAEETASDADEDGASDAAKADEDGKKGDKPGKDSKQAKEGKSATEGAATADGMLGPTETIGKFIINLADQTTTRYLRVVVKVEVSNATTAEEVKNRNPQMRHLTIAYLSSLRLADTQGPGALDAVREALEKRFNHVLTTGVVQQVYFTEFVTQ